MNHQRSAIFSRCAAILALSSALISPAYATQASDAECSITYRASADVTAVIDEKGFNPENYDALCARLKAENLGLDISGDKGVLEQRAYGWVVMRVYDLNSTAVSEQSQLSTSLDKQANDVGATNMLAASIDAAVSAIGNDIGTYVTDLRNQMAKK